MPTGKRAAKKQTAKPKMGPAPNPAALLEYGHTIDKPITISSYKMGKITVRNAIGQDGREYTTSSPENSSDDEDYAIKVTKEKATHTVQAEKTMYLCRHGRRDCRACMLGGESPRDSDDGEEGSGSGAASSGMYGEFTAAQVQSIQDEINHRMQRDAAEFQAAMIRMTGRNFRSMREDWDVLQEALGNQQREESDAESERSDI